MNFKTKEQLAKEAIRYFLLTGKTINVKKTDLPVSLQRKAASFVTLYVDKKLRGCIGNAVARWSLYESIIENAIAAASQDFRFLPIQKGELDGLTVEVSILTPLKIYQPKNIEELLTFLKNDRPGLVIEKYGLRALFLPQVWEELPKVEDFLDNLCFKAGLVANDWRTNTRFWIFYNQKDK